MFYKLVKRSHTLHFNFALLNKETVKAIKEARKRKGVVICQDAEDMFKKLGI